MSYVGLLDCNNFFVSCERLFRPDLVRKPVIVLSSNDGCVVSRSKEVKELGIPMGVPYFHIREDVKQHNIAVFSSNFVLYRDISARVMNTLASFHLPYEQYSIDEAFFMLKEEGEALAYVVSEIKDRVEKWTGIPVSIGVGKNMVLAKYASEFAKKGSGTHVILPNNAWDAHMESIHVGELWGVGRKTTQKLIKNGIQTAADIVRTDSATLRTLFGVEGTRLQRALKGVDERHLESHNKKESIMSSRSFGETTSSKSVLMSALTYHIAHAAEKMRKDGMAARRMSVHARPRRHGVHALHGGTREVLFDRPVTDTRIFITEARRALDELYEREVQYGKVGVALGSFIPSSEVTKSLFMSDAAIQNEKALMEATDTINARFGGEALMFGTALGKGSWRSKSKMRSAAFTTSWRDIPGTSCK